MKKILIGLLCLILAGFAFKFIQRSVKTTDLSSSEDPNVSIQLPEVSPIVSVDFPKEEWKVDNISGFLSSWRIDETSYLESESDYLSFSLRAYELGQKEIYRQEGILWSAGKKYEVTANLTSQKEAIATFYVKNKDEIMEQFRFDVNQNQEVKFDFTSSISNDWTGSIEVELESKEDGENLISVEEFRLMSSYDQESQIRVNHLGYQKEEKKEIIFPYSQGDFFDVVDAVSQEVVYTGAIVYPHWNEKTAERNSRGDFSTFSTEGTYYIRSQILGVSPVFEIKNDLYDEVSKDVLKMISYQRCGTDLDESWAFEFAHEACHLEDAILYEDPQYLLDVSGGWHDAGDYGRYMETGAKTVFDLLFAYQRFPHLFDDNLGIKESGNSVPDILDEVRYELEWMLKLQAHWGGVYGKVTTSSFAEELMPELDQSPLYVLPVETATTGEFIASMALATTIYQEFDPEFAKQCEEAARRAWDYLRWNEKVIEYKNPAEFKTGNYRDSKDSDERFFASIALWSATKESQYLEYAQQLFSGDDSVSKGVSWSDVGAYGSYLYLLDADADKESDFYQKLLQSMINQAQSIVSTIENDGYQVGLEHYSWGSNGKILNQSIILLMTADLENNSYYRTLALKQLDYIFGRNSLNRSFVIGYGNNYPKNPHHRIAEIKDTELKGAIVGGVNGDGDDYLLSQMSGTPLAKMYIDSYDSYSTNEVTIYWNSSLLYVLSYFR